MIVPMKKIAIIMQPKDALGALGALAALGLVHIEHQQPPKSKDIFLLQEDLALVNQAIGVISKEQSVRELKIREAPNPLADWKITARHVDDLYKRLDRLQEYSKVLLQEINEWKVWGDFNPQEIQKLAQNNIHLGLFRIPKKELQRIPKDAVVKEISIRDDIIYCAVITREKKDFGYKEVALPRVSLGAMQGRLAEDEKVMQELRAELKQCLGYKNSLFEIRQSLQKEIEFQQALSGMAQAGALSYLAGYIPKDTEKELVNLAKKEKWGIIIREPSEEGDVPVLIRNPRWIALIRPIFKFLEILPGYREQDISLPFLIFFSIFFGILIGDAGYGLVYSILTFLLHQKARKKGADTTSFFLFYILSFCAIIWGLCTGTFFGQEWILKAGYKPLVPALNDERLLQRFCFFLGALHLSLAHGWRAILKAPSKSAWADAGWIGILWAAFFIARTLVLGDAFPAFCGWLALIGVALVVLFTSPQKNILKFAEEWIAWLVTLPFSFIGNFADVVSYIRLFAVGLAGVAIADAFNAMAAMVGKDNLLMMLLAALIALIGNTLGLVLGPVSVLVHGVRLNLLEFSGHMGLSWSGTAYKPLKE